MANEPYHVRVFHLRGSEYHLTHAARTLDEWLSDELDDGYKLDHMAAIPGSETMLRVRTKVAPKPKDLGELGRLVNG